MISSKSRRCAQCRKKCPSETILSNKLRAFCSMDCLMAFTKTERGKEVIKKTVARHNRQDKVRVLDKQKTRSQWLSEAQTAFNRYVRWRDRHDGCISCGKHVENKYGGNWDAGHFRSRGSAPHLRFHLWNCHKQCARCNRFLSGNTAEYRIALIQKIGSTKVLALESLQTTVKHDIVYLKRIKSIFTRLLKQRNKLCL